MPNFITYKLGRRPYLLHSFSETPEGARLSAPILVTDDAEVAKMDGRALLFWAIEKYERPFSVSIGPDGHSVTVDVPNEDVTRVVSKNSHAKRMNDDGMIDARFAKFFDVRLAMGSLSYFSTGVEIEGRREGQCLVLKGEVTNVVVAQDDILVVAPSDETRFAVEIWSPCPGRWSPLFVGFSLEGVSYGEPVRSPQEGVVTMRTPFRATLERSAALPPCPEKSGGG